MSGWQAGEGLSWRVLEPFGVEVDADFASLPGPAAGDRLLSLFRDHGLVIAHGQKLSLEGQRQLLGLVGPILLREGESGYLSNEGDHAVVKSGLSFHADAAYTEHPFDAIALHAVDVVDGASSTRFVSAELAWERLPPDIREKLVDRAAEMITPGFDLLEARVCNIPEPDAMAAGVRPAVLVNPHTGRRYLNVSEMHTRQLLGLSPEASRDLLNRVFDFLYAPDNRYEHVWRKGDLVIWDNLALQHARGSLEAVGRRVLQRVIVGTEGVAPHTL